MLIRRIVKEAAHHLDKLPVLAPEVAVLDQGGVEVELTNPLTFCNGSSGGRIVTGYSEAAGSVVIESFAAPAS